ncbi:MAG: ATP-dependent DNA helicase RecG, partial [Oscillospiraceae bacterium]|nr:ATP-dependent DNA helicase RecG [Oscillospiraceae bacterium]
MLLDDSILQIQNIGKIKATQLAKLGIKTVRDLLFYFPRGHEDRSKTTTISSADIGESVNIRAKIVKPVVSVYLPNRKSMQKCVVSDCEGAELNITWFNQSYLPKTLKPDKEYIFYGKIEKMGKYSQMTSPKFTSAQNAEKATGILPLYPLTGKITHKMLQDAIRECMPCVGKVADLLPEEIVKQHSLTGLKFAIENIHFPLDIESFELARRRLVFEELFMLMLGLSIYKSANQERVGCVLDAGRPGRRPLRGFVDSLPFKLTNAQNRVIAEIEADLARDVPMARLLQGDVGSGKTVVAASACHITIQSG